MIYYTPKYPMIDYWLNLPPAERTFTGIGVFSSLILTIQMGMVMLGGAIDMPEAEIADTGEGGASGIFSIRTVGAFFAGFGWPCYKLVTVLERLLLLPLSPVRYFLVL
jgi:hypothetical protein